MQVAKYWRNKKLRYRMIRGARNRLHSDSTEVRGRTDADAPKQHVKREIVGLAK